MKLQSTKNYIIKFVASNLVIPSCYTFLDDAPVMAVVALLYGGCY